MSTISMNIITALLRLNKLNFRIRNMKITVYTLIQLLKQGDFN